MRLYFGFHCFLLCYFKFSPLQWNEFKVTYRKLPNFYPNNGYFFTNTLDIETESLSLNYINPTNQNRLNVIMKLHNKGWLNKEIVTFLNLNGTQRRNKKDNYVFKKVKDKRKKKK